MSVSANKEALEEFNEIDRVKHSSRGNILQGYLSDDAEKTIRAALELARAIEEMPKHGTWTLQYYSKRPQRAAFTVDTFNFTDGRTHSEGKTPLLAIQSAVRKLNEGGEK